MNDDLAHYFKFIPDSLNKVPLNYFIRVEITSNIAICPLFNNSHKLNIAQ